MPWNNNNSRYRDIVYPRMKPGASRIGFSGLTFACKDLEVPRKIFPEARPIIKEFVKELNKVSPRTLLIVVFCVLMPIIVIPAIIIPIYFTKNSKSVPVYFYVILMFAIVLKICFIIWYVVRIKTHITKTVNKFRPKLRSFYTVLETFERGATFNINGRQPVIHIIPNYRPRPRQSRREEIKPKPKVSENNKQNIPIKLPIPMTSQNPIEDPEQPLNSENNPLKAVYTLDQAQKDNNAYIVDEG